MLSLKLEALKTKKPQSIDQGFLLMAPKTGFEPVTDRLTADSSTAELLGINAKI